MKHKLLKGLASVALISQLAIPSVLAVQRPATGQGDLSLGATLNLDEEQSTRRLLNAVQADGRIIYIDGETINAYLNDGSTRDTPVYSSAYIEAKDPGFGVQVQIITPQNILVVQPSTYQNAAITSGAKDVLIRIASVTPVTGEGALTGIYALLENLYGVQLSPQDILVAEKEVQVSTQIQEENQLTGNQVSELTAEVKKEVVEQIHNGSGDNINADQIINQVINNYETVQIDDATHALLKELAEEFAKTTAAQEKETSEQLELSIAKTKDHPYAVNLGQYGDQVTFSQQGFGLNDAPIFVAVNKDQLIFRYEDATRDWDIGYEFENIETKDIHVTDGTGTREDRVVHVNTQLTTEEGDVYYVFVNLDNQVALAAPVLDGNEEGVYLEYLISESEVHLSDKEQEELDQGLTEGNDENEEELPEIEVIEVKRQQTESTETAEDSADDVASEEEPDVNLDEENIVREEKDKPRWNPFKKKDEKEDDVEKPEEEEVVTEEPVETPETSVEGEDELLEESSDDESDALEDDLEVSSEELEEDLVGEEESLTDESDDLELEDEEYTLLDQFLEGATEYLFQDLDTPGAHITLVVDQEDEKVYDIDDNDLEVRFIESPKIVIDDHEYKQMLELKVPEALRELASEDTMYVGYDGKYDEYKLYLNIDDEWVEYIEIFADVD